MSELWSKTPLPIAPPVECEAFITADGFPVIQGAPLPNGTYPAADTNVRFRCVLVPVERLPEVGIRDAFAELREASGGRWDGVDPEEFVSELRGKEHEPVERFQVLLPDDDNFYDFRTLEEARAFAGDTGAEIRRGVFVAQATEEQPCPTK